MEIEYIGQKIKQIRELKKLSQQELSDLSGVPIGTIGSIETGKSRNPSFPVIVKLAKAMNVDPVTMDEPVKQITPKTFSKIMCLEVPVLGYVPAGIPTTPVVIQPHADDGGHIERVMIPREVLRMVDPNKAYALIVAGSSLTDLGIDDGDYVVVNPDWGAVIDGKVYLVVVHGQVVLRRVYKENGYLRLRAANAEYEDLKEKDVEIKGRIVLSGKYNYF